MRSFCGSDSLRAEVGSGVVRAKYSGSVLLIPRRGKSSRGAGSIPLMSLGAFADCCGGCGISIKRGDSGPILERAGVVPNVREEIEVEHDLHREPKAGRDNDGDIVKCK